MKELTITFLIINILLLIIFYNPKQIRILDQEYAEERTTNGYYLSFLLICTLLSLIPIFNIFVSIFLIGVKYSRNIKDWWEKKV